MMNRSTGQWLQLKLEPKPIIRVLYPPRNKTGKNAIPGTTIRVGHSGILNRGEQRSCCCCGAASTMNTKAKHIPGRLLSASTVSTTLPAHANKGGISIVPKHTACTATGVSGDEFVGCLRTATPAFECTPSSRLATRTTAAAGEVHRAPVKQPSPAPNNKLSTRGRLYSPKPQ